MQIKKTVSIILAATMIFLCASQAVAAEPDEKEQPDTEQTQEIDPASLIDYSSDGSGIYVVDPETLNDTLAEPKLYTGSAIVMDADTGVVIYEHNAYQRRAMASTTKIMTALLAIEHGDLGREVIINTEMLAYDEPGSTKLGLKIGDRITMHDLIVALILLSGNDCAQSIAVDIAGSYDGFASLMNDRASKIGMMNTHFITPSGLDDEMHYSTAYDMALLACEAARNEDFMSICSIKRSMIKYGNPMADAYVNTHNYLMEGQSHGVKGCDGMKTGYTDDAGYCLVSHCSRDGVNLVCVTLGMPTYWSYQADLYEYAYSQYTQVQTEPDIAAQSLMVIGGSKQAVDLECVGLDKFYVYEPQLGSVTSEVALNAFEYAPVSENQVVGSLRYYYGTTLIKEFPLCSAENVECITTDWLSAYIDAIKFDMNNQ